MKLACADFAFPLLEHDKVLKLIAMLDLQGVDIGLFEGRSHLWPSKEFKNISRSGKTLKKKLDDQGLKPADVFLQMNADFVPYAINHPQASRRRKARDWFSKALEYANVLGCKHVTTLPGVFFDGVPRKDSLARSAEELAWRLDQSKQHKITFGFESHVGSLVPRPKPALKLLKQVPGLTFTLDYTHYARAGIPDSEVEPMIEHTSHFHVRGAKKGRLQVNFNENVIDYKRIYRQMKKVGYKGWLGLEYIWIDWEDSNKSDNISETIQYRDFFRALAKK